MTTSQICKGCGKEFKKRRSDNVYCENNCRHRTALREYRRLNRRPVIPTGTTGAVSELRVSVDLLSYGVHVFRALSPCCPCDLVVLRNGQVLRVEVRTGYRTQGGKVGFGYSSRDDGRHDILAIVLPDSIEYRPSLESLGLMPTSDECADSSNI